MPYQNSKTAALTSTGTIVTGPCTITALGVYGTTDDATAIFRDGGPTGQIVWAMAAGATGSVSVSDSIPFFSPLEVKTDLHVTITGSDAIALVAINHPGSV